MTSEPEPDDSTVVYVSGEFDLLTRDAIVQMINDVASSNRTVVVDMSRTAFMDSTGLMALLDARASQVAAGLDLVLRNPSDAVLRVLGYAGLDEVFTIDQRNDCAS